MSQSTNVTITCRFKNIYSKIF